MAISKINGVAWESIAKYVGIAKASIEKIAGESKPSVGPTCDVVSYGYADGIRTAPRDACLAEVRSYDWDATNSLLYESGGCGSTFAAAGYYSDGRNIYYWDGSSSFSLDSACGGK